MGSLANFRPIPLREQPPHFAMTNHSAPFWNFLYFRLRADERSKIHPKSAKLSVLTKFLRLRTIHGNLKENFHLVNFYDFSAPGKGFIICLLERCALPRVIRATQERQFVLALSHFLCK